MKLVLRQSGRFPPPAAMVLIAAAALVALSMTSNKPISRDSLDAVFGSDANEVRSMLAVSGALDVRIHSEISARTTSRIKLFSASRAPWVNEHGREKFVAEALRRGWTRFGGEWSLCRNRSEVQVDYQYRGADPSRTFLLLHVREAGFSCKSGAQ